MSRKPHSSSRNFTTRQPQREYFWYYTEISGCSTIGNVYMSISVHTGFMYWIIYVASIVLLRVFPSPSSSERVRIPNTYSLNLVLILSSSHGIFFSLVAVKCDGYLSFITPSIPCVWLRIRIYQCFPCQSLGLIWQNRLLCGSIGQPVFCLPVPHRP